jgi:hypothetical protein
MSAHPIDFLGISIDSAGQPGGTELAPGILRDLGLLASLRGGDLGDLPGSIATRSATLAAAPLAMSMSWR